MLRNIADRLAILSAFTIAIAPACGSAATLVRYTFASGFGAAEVAPDLVASVFGAGNAIEDVSLDTEGQPPFSWSGTNWSTTGDAADALVSNSYVWFRITPQPGFSMTLTGITIDIRPEGSGPDDFVISVLDLSTGLSSQLGGQLSHTDQTKFDGERKSWETLFATSADFQNLTGTQEIRIYGFDATQANRDVLFDNIVLNGSVSPIPEPGVFSLLALAGVFLAWRRR